MLTDKTLNFKQKTCSEIKMLKTRFIKLVCLYDQNIKKESFCYRKIKSTTMMFYKYKIFTSNL